MDNDVMISARTLLSLLKNATVEVRDTKDCRQTVIDADSFIEGINGLLYADRMKKYDVLVGLTLDEAYPIAKKLGAEVLFVNRRQIGKDLKYPEPFVDFVRKNIHSDIRNFIGLYGGFRNVKGKKAPDYRLPEMGNAVGALHVSLSGDDSPVIKSVVKLIEPRENEGLF